MGNVELAYRQLKIDFCNLRSLLVRRFGISSEEARKVIACVAREILIWDAVDCAKELDERPTI